MNSVLVKIKMLWYVVVVVTIPSICNAEHITVNFLAVITSIDDMFCMCIPNKAEMIGDTLWGHYSYDIDVLDSNQNPSLGWYNQTELPSGIVVNHELYTWSSDTTNVTFRVTVQDSTFEDIFAIRCYDNLYDPIMNDTTQLISIRLSDWAGEVISSDSILRDPPVLDNWPNYKGLTIFGAGFYVIYSELIWVGFGDPPTSIQNKLSPQYLYCQNHPNPFSDLTTFQFNLQQGAKGQISIYDVSGRLVNIFPVNQMVHGFIVWDGIDLEGNKVPSGIYFYKFITDNKSITNKLIIVR